MVVQTAVRPSKQESDDTHGDGDPADREGQLVAVWTDRRDPASDVVAARLGERGRQTHPVPARLVGELHRDRLTRQLFVRLDHHRLTPSDQGGTGVTELLAELGEPLVPHPEGERRIVVEAAERRSARVTATRDDRRGQRASSGAWRRSSVVRNRKSV